MNEYFIVTANQILQMILMVLVGYAVFRTKMVPESAIRPMTNMLLNVILPLNVLNSFQSEEDLSKAPLLFYGLMISILLHLLFTALSYVFVRARNNPNAVSERASAIFANCGFMGIPLLTAMFGTEGAFYASAYITVYNVALFTQGVYMFSGKGNLKESLKQILSPTVIGVLLSIVLYLLQIRLPEVMRGAVRSIGSMNTPLAMLITGMIIAKSNLRELITARSLYASMLRLLVLPAIGILLFRNFIAMDKMSVAVLLQGACPSGSAISMIAIKCGVDERPATGIFIVSTILCAVTLPMVAMLL